MPGLYAHYLLGEMALEGLDEPFRNLIRDHRDAFDMGLQGPDFLFYGSIFGPKSITQFGSAMHSRPAKDSIIPMTQHLLRLGACSGANLAYMLGFIGHFTLDATSHPYIFAIQETIENHMCLESDFDAALLEERGIQPWKFRFHLHSPKSKEVLRALAQVYGAFSGEIEEKQVLASAKAMFNLRRFLRTPTKLKTAFITGAMKLLGFYDKFYSMLQFPPRRGTKHELLWADQPPEALGVLREQLEEAVARFYKNVTAYKAYMEGQSLDSYFSRDFEQGGVQVCAPDREEDI